MVVVPEFSLRVSDVLDSSFTISAPSKFKGIKVENIRVSIEGKTYDLLDSISVEGITPNSECVISYEYDRTYNGETVHVQAEDIKVKMGKKLPIINELKYEYKDNKLKIYYDIDDEANVITFATIYHSSGSIDIDISEKQVVIDNVRAFNPDDLELTIFVEIDSQTVSSTFITITEFEKFEAPAITPEPAAPVDNKKGCGKSGAYLISVFFAMSCFAFVLRKHR